MERSAMHVMAKRGKSIREIAVEVGHSPTTVARVLREPVDHQPAPRRRRSQVDPYAEAIRGWLGEKLAVVRMLELARGDPERPYTGSRSQFGAMVRRQRQEGEQQQAAAEVPLRFEGLPAEYLQIDWGEIRQFPFTVQAPATRYFLACRLKYSRWAWLRFTTDMRCGDAVPGPGGLPGGARLGAVGVRLRQHEDGDQRPGRRGPAAVDSGIVAVDRGVRGASAGLRPPGRQSESVCCILHLPGTCHRQVGKRWLVASSGWWTLASSSAAMARKRASVTAPARPTYAFRRRCPTCQYTVQ